MARLMQFADSSRDGDVTPLLWLGLPVAAACLVFAAAVAFPGGDGLYARVFRGELGVVELATPLALLVAVAIAVNAMRRPPPSAPLAVRSWLLALALGATYFAGEELSWGQHLLGWETPEAFARINDQGETNLHNTSSWLDQKPKWALRLGALVAIVAAPIVLALRAPTRWSFLRWIWPTLVCLPAALLVVATAALGRLDPQALPAGLGDTMRVSEVEELWIALFVAIYAGSLRRRLPSASP